MSLAHFYFFRLINLKLKYLKATIFWIESLKINYRMVIAIENLIFTFST